MAVFLAGTVNPNGLEACAGIGAWASVTVLAHDARARLDPRVVARAAIAMIVLVLSRSLSSLCLVLIVASGLLLSTRAGLRRLAASPLVRRWAAGVTAATAIAFASLVVVRPLRHLVRHGPDPGSVSTFTIVKRSFGGSNELYRQMIGVFGWLDTSSPAATYLLWTMGLGALVGLCLVVASRRHVAVVLGLIGLTIAVPVAIDSSQTRQIGLGWQGRWTLPFAVGVPIVAALAIAWSKRAGLLERTRLSAVMATLFVAAQFSAFAQHLRRNTVGAGGSLNFWLHPRWAPPLPAWLLLAGCLAVLIALAAWIWRPDGRLSCADHEDA